MPSSWVFNWGLDHLSLLDSISNIWPEQLQAPLTYRILFGPLISLSALSLPIYLITITFLQPHSVSLLWTYLFWWKRVPKLDQNNNDDNNFHPPCRGEPVNPQLPSNCVCCLHEVHLRTGYMQLMAKYITAWARKIFNEKNSCVGVAPFSTFTERNELFYEIQKTRECEQMNLNLHLQKDYNHFGGVSHSFLKLIYTIWQDCVMTSFITCSIGR